jgi:hypothetical protein
MADSRFSTDDAVSRKREHADDILDLLGSR